MACKVTVDDVTKLIKCAMNVFFLVVTKRKDAKKILNRKSVIKMYRYL